MVAEDVNLGGGDAVRAHPAAATKRTGAITCNERMVTSTGKRLACEAKEAALRHDADQPAIVRDHRDAADAVGQERVQRPAGRVVRADRADLV